MGRRRPRRAGHVNPMNTAIALAALLLLAGLLTSPAADAAPNFEADSDAACDLVTVGPFYPYVLVDLSCLPLSVRAEGL